MKVTELRIGNWYDCHEGDEMNNTAIVQLRDIIWTNDGIGYELKHLNDRAVGVTLYPEKLKPIPLTKEWLEKFGFESDSYQDMYVLGWLKINCDKTKGKPELWIENITGKVVYIEHVHQLQNLYFALTGEEIKCS